MTLTEMDLPRRGANHPPEINLRRRRQYPAAAVPLDVFTGTGPIQILPPGVFLLEPEPETVEPNSTSRTEFPSRRTLRPPTPLPSWWQLHWRWLSSLVLVAIVLGFGSVLTASTPSSEASASVSDILLGKPASAKQATPASARLAQPASAKAPAAKKPPAVKKKPKGHKMTVRVSALNLRHVPTTRRNQPIKALRQGTKVTVLSVTKASSSPDNRTRWAKTPSGYMWFGGLQSLHQTKPAQPKANKPHGAKKHTAPKRMSYGRGPAASKAYAKTLFAKHGWSVSKQFGCLNKLWTRESEWRWQAYNKNGGATGIPQALPGSKMRSAGSDWRTNPHTQIKWGLSYIDDRYGTPCAAWTHSESHSPHWY